VKRTASSRDDPYDPGKGGGIGTTRTQTFRTGRFFDSKKPFLVSEGGRAWQKVDISIYQTRTASWEGDYMGLSRTPDRKPRGCQRKLLRNGERGERTPCGEAKKVTCLSVDSMPTGGGEIDPKVLRAERGRLIP